MAHRPRAASQRPSPPLQSVADLEAQYQPLFHSIVRHVSIRLDRCDQAEAEDAAADALERTLRHIAAGQTVGAGWPHAIAYQQAAQGRRANSQLIARVGESQAHAGNDCVIYSRTSAQRPAQIPDWQLRHVRELLTPTQAEALEIRMAGTSYRAGASQLGISQPAFTSRITGAHKRLRQAGQNRRRPDAGLQLRLLI